MAVEFVPMTKNRQYAVAAVERDAYQLRTGLYDEYEELKVLLEQQAARRYSFLLKDDDYQSYCIASLQESLVQKPDLPPALYISDFAVRASIQRSYYGLHMADELLRRAHEDDVQRIEFHARGSTLYSAIHASRHTKQLLEWYGYYPEEVSASDIYTPDGQWQESFHLVSLEKIAPNHL